jgi:hypothetical protein
MTHGKKATVHVVALILVLSLFVYSGQRASHVVDPAKPVHTIVREQRADLYLWGSIGIGALIAALMITSTLYVVYGEEAARNGRRPRFSSSSFGLPREQEAHGY